MERYSEQQSRGMLWNKSYLSKIVFVSIGSATLLRHYMAGWPLKSRVFSYLEGPGDELGCSMVLTPSTGWRETWGIRKNRERGLVTEGVRRGSLAGTPRAALCYCWLGWLTLLSILPSHGHRWQAEERTHHPETRRKKSSGHTKPSLLAPGLVLPKFASGLISSRQIFTQMIHF